MERGVRQTLELWYQLDIPPTYPHLGPFPVDDQQGYAVTIAMLMKSKEPGRYAHCQQFETIRKLRAAYTNVYMASVVRASSLRTISRDRAKNFLNECPTHSLWFERFAEGCLGHMGQIVKQDMAISLPVMHALMKSFEEDWSRATRLSDKHHIARLAAFSVTAICGSFRGPEVFLVDLFGLRKYLTEVKVSGETEFVVIPLLGHFKNEVGEQYHLTPLAAVTTSGFNVKSWLECLVQVREEQHKVNGPEFTSKDGNLASSKDYEFDILSRLQDNQSQNPNLIPADVNVLEEYGISYSFCRGSTSEARSRGVDNRDVKMVNRWRDFENAKRPRMSMQDHYSDIRILIPLLIKYSIAL